MWHTPHACTRTSASPGPGSGTTIVSTISTGAPLRERHHSLDGCLHAMTCVSSRTRQARPAPGGGRSRRRPSTSASHDVDRRGAHEHVVDLAVRPARRPGAPAHRAAPAGEQRADARAPEVAVAGDDRSAAPAAGAACASRRSCIGGPCGRREVRWTPTRSTGVPSTSSSTCRPRAHRRLVADHVPDRSAATTCAGRRLRIGEADGALAVGRRTCGQRLVIVARENGGRGAAHPCAAATRRRRRALAVGPPRPPGSRTRRRRRAARARRRGRTARRCRRGADAGP